MKISKILTLLSVIFLASTPSFGNNQKISIQPKTILVKRQALGFDGTYNVPLKTDLKMKDEVFNHTAIIEKQGENVYMTFTQDDSRDMTDMKLLLPGKVGTMVFSEGNKKSYVYSLSEDDLNNPFPFSVFIPIMQKLVTFNMNLLMDEITFVGDSIRDLGERPARYIPEFQTDFTDLEMEKNSIYYLPDVKSMILDQEVNVSKKVTYLSSDGEENIEIPDNKLLLEELGTYKVTYIAESDLYKTSLGNNTKSEVSFKITSKIGASSLAKYKDINNCVDDKAQLQANIVKKGPEFEKIANKMKSIADNYQIFNLEMFLENGDKVNLTDEIEIYLKADQFFDRNKVKIASLDENNNLNEYSVDNYGRYISFKTDKLGTYIVYVEGVEFHMPIWGYVLIGGGALLLISCGVASIIIVKHKRKKSSLNKSGI